MVQIGRLALVAGLGLLSSGLTAAVPTKRAATCETPTKRRSWHDMAAEDKKAYLAAQVCAMKSPAKVGKLPGAVTRWDELASLHQIHALQIHSTGQFLPYHRYFLHVHEFLLNECGYHGGMPYWDETRDAGKFSSSPVFDPKTGLGGTGKGAQKCVADGPFANLTVNIGPGFTTQPRCVNRQITDYFSYGCSKAYVDAAISGATYEAALNAIYMGPHLNGHIALSMMNGDSITSAGDPLFMLHHGFVDKMWWDWQAKDLAKRLVDMGTNNAQDPKVGFIEFPGGVEEDRKMFGSPTPAMEALTPNPQNGDNGNVNVTLNHIMTSLGIIPDATVGDVMDIKGGYLCYEYV